MREEHKSPEQRATAYAQAWKKRPAQAPKPVPDIRHIVNHAPEYHHSCAVRRYPDLHSLIDMICERVSSAKNNRQTAAALYGRLKEVGLQIRVIKTEHRTDKRSAR